MDTLKRFIGLHTTMNFHIHFQHYTTLQSHQYNLSFIQYIILLTLSISASTVFCASMDIFFVFPQQGFSWDRFSSSWCGHDIWFPLWEHWAGELIAIEFWYRPFFFPSYLLNIKVRFLSQIKAFGQMDGEDKKYYLTLSYYTCLSYSWDEKDHLPSLVCQFKQFYLTKYSDVLLKWK